MFERTGKKSFGGFRPGAVDERGSAMVEFSILMIVFVPMITYGFYIMDLGHHLLDVQETVVSTTWDYTAMTHEADPHNGGKLSENLANVFHANRFEYIDHTSAYDDFANLQSSADEKKYHFELGSKAAWIGQGTPGRGVSDPMAAESDYESDYDQNAPAQVRCALDNTADLKWMVATSVNPAYEFGTSTYNRGGLVTCWAKLAVYNYVIPEKFMQEHAHEDLSSSKLETRTTDVETLGAGDNKTVSGRSVILRDHAALSFGTWAIDNGDKLNATSSATDGDLDTCPDAKNPFYERVAWMYSGGGIGNTNAFAITYAAVSGAVGVYAATAGSNELEVVVPVPIARVGNAPGSADGSAEGKTLLGSCSTQIMLDALGGRGHNPVGVSLVARHNRTNPATGVLQKRPVSEDFLAMEPGYESTPFQRGNPDYQRAWQNRGQFYMGERQDKAH